MARIVAIDFGTVRIGLAATDTMQMIASALDTVPARECIAYLQEYIKREPVEMLVVGEAKRLDGSPAQSAENIRAFVKLLKKHIPGMPVEMEDERFTSKMASHAILHSGLSKSKRRDKKLVDKVSAVLILQSYLERRNNNLNLI